MQDQTLTDRANRLEANQEWREAANLWQQVVASAPVATNLVRLGSALRKAGELAEAEYQYRAALETDPTCADAHYSLGLLLYDQSRLPEARSAFEFGLQIEERRSILTVLGGLLLDQGLPEQAEMRFRRSLELKPDDDEALFGLGMAVKDRDLTKAAAYLTEASRLDPTLAGLSRELGHVLMALQDYDGAKRALKEAVATDPEDAWAHNLLGHVLTLSDELTEARTEFLAAAQLRPSIEFFWVNAAEANARLGFRDEADKLFLRALSSDVADLLTSLKYGLFLKDVGRPQKAISYLERASRDSRLAERAQRALSEIQTTS